MSVIDKAVLRDAPIQSDPFDHVIAPGLVRDAYLSAVHRDFPKIDGPGSVPLLALKFGPTFGELIESMRSVEFAEIFSEKFDLDLKDRPTMVTVRGRCRARDGRIHTDSREKLVTVLLYLNPVWENQGGRLRLFRKPDDIEDFQAEVPPDEGTLLAFKCSANAWHGHKSFEGERRAIQLNWVTNERYIKREERRHKVSKFFKRLGLAS